MAEPEQDEGVAVLGGSDAVFGDGGEVGLVLHEDGGVQALLEFPDQPPCQAGSPAVFLSSPVTGSIRPGAPMPTLCSGAVPAVRAVRSSIPTARSTANRVPVSLPIGRVASARVTPSRSATATATLSVRTSRAARCARSATIPYSRALGPRRSDPLSPTTRTRPAS